MANEKKTERVILGLLSHESMTGYEIKKRLDTSLSFFWGASFGSIYPALNGLERDKLVTKEETTENGRDKIIYTITDQGRECLAKWLEVPVVKDEVRYETLLKLFFGAGLGPGGARQHIENFEAKIRMGLPLLEGFVQELDGIRELEKDHTYYMITAMFGVKTYQAYLEWCEEAKEILNEMEEK